MIDRKANIGIITDEVSRNLREALEVSRAMGIDRFELREGSIQRTPDLSPEEVDLVDEAIRNGCTVTALSPGVFKQPVENRAQINSDLERKLPATLDLANRFKCRTVIIFGFEKMNSDPASRLDAQRVFEKAALRAEVEGIVLAIENEPDFWVDKPLESVALISEVGHPSLKLNWDPANLHWGGTCPTKEHVEILSPHIRNLHVKDFTPDDEKVPWRPLGEGVTPWRDLLAALEESVEAGHLQLDQYTIETHCEPLIEGSRRSLSHLMDLFSELGVGTTVERE